MNYTFQYCPFKVADIEEARTFNHKVLAGNVKGVKCTSATSFEDWDIPEDMKEVVSHRLPLGAHFGTVEVYENGYTNLFVKQGTVSIGIIKLWMSEKI